jgi:transcriptional regulator with XRE-family HTH domain
VPVQKDIFAKLLKAALKDSGINQVELARRLGMTPQAIGAYTNAHRQPGYELLLQVAAALQISPEALVPDVHEREWLEADSTAMTADDSSSSK